MDRAARRDGGDRPGQRLEVGRVLGGQAAVDSDGEDVEIAEGAGPGIVRRIVGVDRHIARDMFDHVGRRLAPVVAVGGDRRGERVDDVSVGRTVRPGVGLDIVVNHIVDDRHVGRPGVVLARFADADAALVARDRAVLDRHAGQRGGVGGVARVSSGAASLDPDRHALLGAEATIGETAILDQDIREIVPFQVEVDRGAPRIGRVAADTGERAVSNDGIRELFDVDSLLQTREDATLECNVIRVAVVGKCFVAEIDVLQISCESQIGETQMRDVRGGTDANTYLERRRERAVVDVHVLRAGVQVDGGATSRQDVESGDAQPRAVGHRSTVDRDRMGRRLEPAPAILIACADERERLGQNERINVRASRDVHDAALWDGDDGSVDRAESVLPPGVPDHVLGAGPIVVDIDNAHRLVRADVGGVALVTRHAALIIGCRSSRAAVDGQAAGEQRVGRGRPAVVGERAEQGVRITKVVRSAGDGAVDVVGGRAGELVGVAANDAVGNRAVDGVQQQATPLGGRRTDCRVQRYRDVIEIDIRVDAVKVAAAAVLGRVATDRAIRHG
ncbi:MAG: hypothetical protein BWX70_00867 [Verrucomicrobia bacterium ADurb.Bin070]|nr:MAG: hypothetical protein BWX70_00867 [Verrucomicrobia bacterium ADurb.Bin070]